MSADLLSWLRYILAAALVLLAIAIGYAQWAWRGSPILRPNGFATKRPNGTIGANEKTPAVLRLLGKQPAPRRATASP
jgi:hypothetical protein